MFISQKALSIGLTAIGVFLALSAIWIPMGYDIAAKIGISGIVFGLAGIAVALTIRKSDPT